MAEPPASAKLRDAEIALLQERVRRLEAIVNYFTMGLQQLQVGATGHADAYNALPPMKPKPQVVAQSLVDVVLDDQDVKNHNGKKRS